MKSVSIKMNNGMIYQYALTLNKALNDNDLQMPVAVIFSIEKNILTARKGQNGDSGCRKQ